MGNEQDAGNPGVAFQEAGQIETPRRDFITRLGTALNQGHKGSPMDQALQAHNQRRVDEAQMHHATASTASGALLYDNQMLQQAQSDPDSVKGYTFLTPEQRTTYQNQYETAMDNYEKIVGVDKNTKQALQRSRAIIGHLMTPPKGGQGAGQVRAGNGQSNMAAPPAAPGSSAPFMQGGGGGTAQLAAAAGPAASGTSPMGQRGAGSASLIPPPQPPDEQPNPQSGSPPDSAANSTDSDDGMAQLSPADQKILSYRKFQMQAPFIRQQIVRNLNDVHNLKLLEQQRLIYHRMKMDEIEAAAKAKRENPTGRATPLPPTSMVAAQTLAEKFGMTYKAADPAEGDENGNLILSRYGRDMQIVPMQQNGHIIGYAATSQKTKEFMVGNILYTNPMYDTARAKDEATMLGVKNLGTESVHSAPGIDVNTGQYGPVISRTGRTPVTGVPLTAGENGQGGTPLPTPGGAAPPAAAPSATPGQAPAPAGRPAKTPAAPAGAAAPTARAPKGGGGGQFIPFPAASQLNQRIVPVREATTQILGSWNNPDAPSMKDYGKIADNSSESKALGNALRLSIEHLTSKERASGGFMEMLYNYGGVTENIIDSERQVMEDVIKNLSPQNQMAYNATMSGYGMMAGLRSLNKSSAAQFAMTNLEREFPLIGLNSFSKTSFDDKLSHIATEIYNGYSTLPVPQGEKDYVKQFIKKGDNRISKLPVAGGKKGPSQEALDFLNKNEPKKKP